MRPNPQFPADLDTFAKEILNRKLHFFVQWRLCYPNFSFVQWRLCYPSFSFESDAVVEDDTFKLQSILRNQPTDLSLCLYRQSQTSITKVLSYLYNDVQMDIGYIQKFQEISRFHCLNYQNFT